MNKTLRQAQGNAFGRVLPILINGRDEPPKIGSGKRIKTLKKLLEVQPEHRDPPRPDPGLTTGLHLDLKMAGLFIATRLPKD
ncbi:MAG: hypothetical protein JW963_07765 [Anaerolineales bacterium]|nr:hypothetical protein [Anaerolineales bacterium]